MSVKYLDFEIPTEGVPKGRPRFANYGGFVRTYTDKKTRDFETTVAYLAKEAMQKAGFPRAESGAVRLCLKFFFPPLKSWTKAQRLRLAQCIELPKTTKPDVDNLGKAVCDGLNGIVYRDDAMVASLGIEKVFADRKPGISVHLALDTDE